MMLRRQVFRMLRMAATDPRVQAKALELFETQVMPRAREVWANAKPKIAATREDLREAARAADPRRDPKGFVREVRRRIAARRERRQEQPGEGR